MQASGESTDSAGATPTHESGLFIAALVAALLGLSLIDVAPSPAASHAGPSRSVDCIVASAVFAGVSTPAPELP